MGFSECLGNPIQGIGLFNSFMVQSYWGDLNGLESHTITDIVHAQQVGSYVKKTLANLPEIEQIKLIKQKLEEYKNK